MPFPPQNPADRLVQDLDRLSHGTGSVLDVLEDVRAMAYGPPGSPRTVAEERTALLMGVATLLGDSHKTPEEREAVIAAADRVAGEVNGLCNVSDGDIGRLAGARPGGITAGEQFAAARVDAAIARAHLMLATMRQARSMGDNSAYVQGTYASPEEYRAWREKLRREQSKD